MRAGSGITIVRGFCKALRLRLALLAAVLAPLSSAAAADPEIRAWDHGQEGQLVLDWGEPVDHEVFNTADRMVLRLAEPLGEGVHAQLEAARSKLSDYVTDLTLSEDRRELAVALAEDFSVDHRTVGGTVILAFQSSPPPAPSTDPQRPSVGIVVQDNESFSRLTLIWPEAVAPEAVAPEAMAYEVEQQSGEVLIRFDRPAAVDAAALAAIASPRIADLQDASDPTGPLVLRARVPAGATTTHRREDGRVIVDVVGVELPATADDSAGAPAAADVAGWPVAPPVPAHHPHRADVPEAAADDNGQASAMPAAPTQAAERQARFDPSVPAAMAAFVRSGALWIIFASERPVDVNALAEAGRLAFGPGEIVPARGGVAIRYAVEPDARFRVERDGLAWAVRVADASDESAAPIAVLSEPNYLLGPRLFLPVAGATGPVTVVDPEVGDTIHVVPLTDAASGIAETHDFVDVTLLPAAQGVAILPHSEAIEVDLTSIGIGITAEGGLILSSGAPAPIAEDPSEAEEEPLYDPVAWRGTEARFVRARQELQQAVAEASDDTLNRARLQLARFYFAANYGVEAAAILRMVDADAPDAASHIEYLALRGAVKVLAGDPEGALADLGDPRLASIPEVALWRGAANAHLEEWPEAAREFDASGEAIDSFPPVLGGQLAMLSAEAAIRTGDLSAAEERLNWLIEATGGRAQRQPGVQFMQGMVARLRGDSPVARAAWRQIADSNDRKHRVLAGMALVDLAVEEGEMAPSEAAEALEALRFAWRGDTLEFRLLERLGNLHWQAGSYRKAMVAWDRAIDTFADLAAAGDLADSRDQRFAELFSTELLDGISPTTALSLYEDYEALVPEGEVGNEMIEHLAERLVSIDLLDRASDLLTTLATTRLSGEARHRVQTRVAGIQLLDGDAPAALRTLEALIPVTEAQDIRFDQRLLRAQALAQTDQGDAALALLEDTVELTPVQSALQRAARLDIAWRLGSWAVAAEELANRLGTPPPLGETVDERQARLAIDYGIALALADDRAGLDRLAIEFGPAMEGTVDENTFAVVTRAQGAAGPIADLATVRRQVSEVGVFQSFLASYRDGEATGETVIE